MLARREPVTLRSLVADTGVSTMAVYTHFGSMTGLWSAVRQDGFTRLAERLAAVTWSPDPVRDLVRLGAAYLAHALAQADLYRTMFDDAFPLEDPQAAAGTFRTLIAGIDRAVQRGRFAEATDGPSLATDYWIIGHGIASLTIAGVLRPGEVDARAADLVTALFVAAGDEPDRTRRSFANGWTSPTVASAASS